MPGHYVLCLHHSLLTFGIPNTKCSKNDNKNVKENKKFFTKKKLKQNLSLQIKKWRFQEKVFAKR